MGKMDYGGGMRLLPLLLVLVRSVASFAAVPSEYLPTSEGMEWTMDGTFTTPDGKIETGTLRRVFGPPETRNGRIYIRRRTWAQGEISFPEMTKWMRLDSKGLHSLDPLEPKQSEQMEVPLPLVIGMTWSLLVGGEKVTQKVVGLEDVTIGEKVYKECFHIRSDPKGGAYYEDYWEAPKVGWVRSETTYPSGFTITWTLREFKPGKK